MDWLKEQWNWFKGFFSEPTGKASIKRVISFLVVTAFLQSYLKVAYETLAIVDIPLNWGMVILGILGLQIWANKIQDKT